MPTTRNTARRAPGHIATDDFLSAIEAILDPGVLVATLWALALWFEGELAPAYLILSVIVFSITFPGTSRLQFPLRRVFTDVLFGWVWIAALLLLTGFATRYIREFSAEAITAWLWVAPTAQIGAHERSIVEIRKAQITCIEGGFLKNRIREIHMAHHAAGKISLTHIRIGE